MPQTDIRKLPGYDRLLDERQTILLLLLDTSGWSVRKLAAAVGIPARQLRRYLKGEELPPWLLLFVAATEMKLLMSVIHELRVVVHESRRHAGRSEPYSLGDPELWEVSSDLVRETLRGAGDPRLKMPPAPRRTEENRGEERRAQRQRACEIWETLRGLAPTEWRNLPGERDELKSWAVCERLCHESARRVASRRRRDVLEGFDPEDFHLGLAAEGMADLAFRIACLLPHDEPWMCDALREYAWAHVGNVRRASGSLSWAEEAFYHADVHYLRGWDENPGPLDASRPFYLKALLRRDQGCVEDARALLRLAEPLAHPEDPSLSALQAELEVLDLKTPQRSQAAEIRKAIRKTLDAAMDRLAQANGIAEEVQRLRGLLPQFEAALGDDHGLVLAAKLFTDLAEEDRLSMDQANLLWQSFLHIESALTSPHE